MELKIEHLSKHFKDKNAVDDVCLTLPPRCMGITWCQWCRKNDSHADDCRYYDTNKRNNLL